MVEVNEKFLKVVIGKLVSLLNEKQQKEFCKWLKKVNVELDEISKK